jgi:hypothetical protein
MMAGAGGRGGGVIQTYLTVLLVDRFGVATAIWTMAVSYMAAMVILRFIRLDHQ